MKSQNLRGNLLLMLTAFIWGCAFVAQSMGMDHIGPFTFQAIRMAMGGLVLIPFIFITRKKKQRRGTYLPMTASQKKRQALAGIVCGCALFAGATFQQCGIQYTTVGKAGFISAMYLLLVPIFGLLFFRKKVERQVWVSVAIAVVGMYFLCLSGGSLSLNKGDGYVLLCALMFALHILVIDRFADVDGVILSCSQFFVCSALSFIGTLIFEQPTWSGIFAARYPLMYSGFLSCGVAYTLQVIGQQQSKNPAVASLIMSLESVFSLLAGIVILREIPSAREFLGIALMFAAILLAQLPPISEWKNRKQKEELI